MRVTIVRNTETFPSKQMYPYLSLDERKVAEFYHDIDRRRWLVWLKWLIFITFSGQLMVSLPGHPDLEWWMWQFFFDKPAYCRWHPSDFSFLSTSADKTSTLWALPPVWAGSSWCWRWWWTSPSPSSPIFFKRQLMCSISLLLYLIFWQSTPKTFKVWLIFLEKCVNSNLD